MDRTELELAWAAGFFDGEGTVTVHRGGRAGGSRYLMAAVKQSADGRGAPATLERLQAAVGLGRVGGPYSDSPTRRGFSPNRRAYFMWYARGHEAEIAIERLWPELGETKRREALSGLEAIRDHRVA